MKRGGGERGVYKKGDEGGFERGSTRFGEKKAKEGDGQKKVVLGNDDEWLFRSATSLRGRGPEKHPFPSEPAPGSKATGFCFDLLPQSCALHSRGKATSFSYVWTDTSYVVRRRTRVDFLPRKRWARGSSVFHSYTVVHVSESVIECRYFIGETKSSW